MTVKVYREGKDEEVYKELKKTEIIEEIDNYINESEEEAKELEEEIKAQMELEKLKQENPDKYYKLVRDNKKAKIFGILFLIWFFGSIALIFVFSAMEKVPLMLSVFGHYFSVFGVLGYVSNKDGEPIEKMVPIIFMLFGLTFMVGCLLYQFGFFTFQ